MRISEIIRMAEERFATAYPDPAMRIKHRESCEEGCEECCGPAVFVYQHDTGDEWYATHFGCGVHKVGPFKTRAGADQFMAIERSGSVSLEEWIRLSDLPLPPMLVGFYVGGGGSMRRWGGCVWRLYQGPSTYAWIPVARYGW